jgi:hypothetical protein
MGRKGHERISQREYARRLGVSNELVSRAIKEGKISSKGWDAKAGKIVFEIANREWGVLYIKQDATEALIQQPEGMPPVPAEEVSTPIISLTPSTTFAEATRVEKLMSAKLKTLDVQERTGELVSKEHVYKELFAFGQQIRTSILAVPDRFIDNILAAPNRGEAHIVLTSALHEVLESLTDPKIDLKPRQ